MADTCEESSSEGSDSILSDNFTRHTRVNSHSEISLCKGTPQLHMWKVRVKRMVLWEGHLMEGLDWNDGKRQAENGIAWQKIVPWPPFFIGFVLMRTSPETVIFARKAYLKIKLLVKTPLHEYREVARSG